MGFYPRFGTGQALRRKTLFLSVFLSGLTAVLRAFEATIGAIPLRGTGFASDLAAGLTAGLTAATFAGFLLARVGGPAFALRSFALRASAGASSLGTSGDAGLAALATRTGLGSNSNPVVPSGLRTRRGGELRRGRC